jgi:hypothetical protein
VTSVACSPSSRQRLEWYPAIVRALEGGGYRGREGVERFAADTSEHWADQRSFTLAVAGGGSGLFTCANVA